MATITLRSGRPMPTIGLGTYKLQGELCTNTVKTAILQAGYRLMYQNEPAVGLGLHAAISAGVRREDLFVVTKLWCNDYTPDKIRPALMRSMEGLGVDYLDMYLLHYPFAVSGCETYPPASPKLEPVPMHQVWRQMEEFVHEGLVKEIGVCNWPAAMLVDTLSYSRIKPAVNQIELHPYNAQKDLVSFCGKVGVVCTAFGSLGGVDYGSLALADPLLSHPLVSELAGKYGKTPAQILINFEVSRGTAVIAKGSSLQHLQENREAGEFRMGDEDVGRLEGLDRGLRFYARGFYKALGFSPFI